jgi:hypothetical protein
MLWLKLLNNCDCHTFLLVTTISLFTHFSSQQKCQTPRFMLGHVQDTSTKMRSHTHDIETPVKYQ